MNEKDLFDFDYSLYLEHLAVCQNNTVRCVAEAVCISENQIDTLVTINEAFIDTIKNIINRIVTAVKKQFGKFLESMRVLWEGDEKWLKRPEVKDIILNKPFKEREPITMTKYHEENFDKFMVKPFDFDYFKKVATATNVEAEFINTYFSGDLIKSDGGEIHEQVKEAIAGEEEEMNINSLNKQNLYNFCLNWPATQDKLEKDKATLYENGSKLTTSLTRYASDIESKLKDNLTKNPEPQPKGEEKDEESGEGTQTADTQKDTRSATQVGNDALSKHESTSYSLLYDTYVTELFKSGKVKDSKTTASGSGSVSGTSQVKTGVVKLDQGTADNTVNAYNTGEANEEKLKEVETMRDKANDYYKLEAGILTGKLSAAESMYKDYMTVLRLHVKDYIGEDKSGTTDRSSSVEPGKAKIGDEEYTFQYITVSGAELDGSNYWLVGDNAIKTAGSVENNDISKNLEKYRKKTKFNTDARHVVKVNANSFGTKYYTFIDGGWKSMEVIKDMADKVKAAIEAKKNENKEEKK